MTLCQCGTETKNSFGVCDSCQFMRENNSNPLPYIYDRQSFTPNNFHRKRIKKEDIEIEKQRLWDAIRNKRMFTIYDLRSETTLHQKTIYTFVNRKWNNYIEIFSKKTGGKKRCIIYKITEEGEKLNEYPDA